jgi:predicted transcriptional regulator
MVRNEIKYQKALEFRKRGFTYSEIAKIVGISKATASLWLSKKAFSKRVKEDNIEKAGRDNKKRINLLNKAKASQRQAHYIQLTKTAKVEYKHYKANPLFMAGLMLYRAQGDLNNTSPIRLSSTDQVTHRIFIKFAHEYLGIDKSSIRFWLLLYANLDPKKCVASWSQAIKLPSAQFSKTQVLKNETIKQALHYGVGNTIIGNTVLKHKLLLWVELATKEL